MNTFDPMAIAIDWLDAYREASLSITDLYASDATLECGCNGTRVATGKAAIAEYWLRRFAEKPAEALEELQSIENGIQVSYRVPNGLVQAKLYFDETGKITRSACVPFSGAPYLS
jgi:hypothetical protein